MLTILNTEEDITLKTDTISKGCWISLSSPSNQEVLTIADSLKIDLKDIRSALDSDEVSRLEKEDNYTLLLIDIPTVILKNQRAIYTTIPLSVIYSRENIVTVCLEDTPVIKKLINNKREICTYKRTQLIYKILYNSAKLYMEYLIKINSMRSYIETKVSTKETLTELYDLEKSLVYFKTSLKSNEIVLNRLLKQTAIKQYPEDEELLEDVLIEYKQAIEMTQIYYEVLDNTISKYSALMDYDLNNAMKLLTSFTIVLAIPTVISGIFGMNLINMPWSGSPSGFWIVNAITVALCIMCIMLLRKKKMM
ncbi:MAG: magnesium transporter CorA family protein [Clostridia bacterium]|nr:magnesium transporter CorA family protein [Clostridia bacterium]